MGAQLRGDANIVSPATVSTCLTADTVSPHETPPLQARSDACEQPEAGVERPAICAIVNRGESQVPATRSGDGNENGERRRMEGGKSPGTYEFILKVGRKTQARG